MVACLRFFAAAEGFLREGDFFFVVDDILFVTCVQEATYLYPSEKPRRSKNQIVNHYKASAETIQQLIAWRNVWLRVHATATAAHRVQEIGKERMKLPL